jgi:hypothetical protein
MHMMGHEGGQGGGVSPGDLKLLGVTLGAKEKVGGDKVENQELGAESLHRGVIASNSNIVGIEGMEVKARDWPLEVGVEVCFGVHQ